LAIFSVGIANNKIQILAESGAGASQGFMDIQVVATELLDF
jgi:hypothetical protein